MNNQVVAPYSFAHLASVAIIHAVVVFFLAAEPVWSWIPADGRAVAVSFRENSFILGAIGVVLGFSIGRIFQPNSVVFGRSSVVSTLQAGRTLLLPTIVSQLLGCSIGLVGAFTLVDFARYGEAILAILGTTAGIVALTIWGFTIGAFVHGNLGLSIALASVLFLSFTPMIVNSYFISETTMPALALGMIWGIPEPRADLTFSYATEILRIILYVAFALTVLGVGGYLIEKSRYHLKTIAPKLAVSLGSIALVFVGLSVMVTPQLFVRDGVPLSCRTDRSVTVCQHQVYEHLIPTIMHSAQSFSDVIPGFSVTAVPVTEVGSGDVYFSLPHGEKFQWERDVNQKIADYLSGVTQCTHQVTQGASQANVSLPQALELSEILLDRADLEGTNSVANLSDWAQDVRAMADADFAHWYQENSAAIRACDLN